MTQKRFTKQEISNSINRYRIHENNFMVEILDNGIPMHYSTIVNRLNEQDKIIIRLKEENGQLKSYTGEMEDYLARLEEKNEQLKKENLNLSEELDYYKTKCASLEIGLLQLRRDADDQKKN